jgi:hypothetical protein
LLAVTLVSSLIVTALTVRLGAFSPWQAVYEFVPGASVIVGVGRWVLTLTLPVSILLAAGADWIQQRSQGHAVLSQVVLLAAAAFIAVEQIGRIPAVYSGEVAFRYHQKLSKVIPASCEAFLLAPPLRFDKLPVVTRQDFDEAKYLAANPDVAQAWPGGAWDHFSQFGYREGRVLDKETNLRARPPEDDPAQIFFNFHYHLSAMIASAISGRPTVNGASGLGPADYTVANLYQRDLAGQLGTWMNGYPGKGACVVSEEIEPYSLTDLGPRSAFLGVPLME